MRRVNFRDGLARPDDHGVAQHRAASAALSAPGDGGGVAKPDTGLRRCRRGDCGAPGRAACPCACRPLRRNI